MPKSSVSPKALDCRGGIPLRILWTSGFCSYLTRYPYSRTHIRTLGSKQKMQTPFLRLVRWLSGKKVPVTKSGKFDSQDPHDGGKGLSSARYPLVSTQKLCIFIHTCPQHFLIKMQFKIFTILFYYVYLYGSVCAHECQCQKHQVPQHWVTGGREPSNVDAGNQTLVLSKGSRYS